MQICILYTGGTLGMRPGPDGLAPVPGFLTTTLQAQYPGVEVIEYTPLLDSSDMTPADWNRIAQDMVDRVEQFDGFVVLHGTDTLAWSASALSFVLAGFGKPIVVTGAQHPWEALDSDAPGNVADAISLAASGALAEVAVVFAGVAYRGNRVRKVDCERNAAFNSPNCQPLARRFGHGWAFNNVALPVAKAAAVTAVNADARVVRLTLAPGFSAGWLAQALLVAELDGVVLETYGSGNVPSQADLTDAIAQLAKRALVVNCTQCVSGAVQMGLYASSKTLLEAGVLNAHDMTPEAALAKLHWVCAQTSDLSERRQLFIENRAGELTTLE
ncbi:asparaginase [Silvimonas amylolytica]|uniref:L-asparaginase 1 n=1 Tax=Silvimonas amylolytica TaxID=449663 RepID=A0ABQ2PQM2_9NEIS|nr:asparaginase [Silvimonas amylolytica]GGP27525.1 L-asparaginase 1 [Silvimonas amylolytica]